MTSTSCYRTVALLSCVFLLVFVSHTRAQTNVQGQWTKLPTLMPVNPIHVALLPAGQILVVAGSGNCSPTQSGCPSGPPYGASNGSGAGLYDPVSQNFTPFTVPWDMFCNGMVLLPDGRVLIAGGTLQYGPFLGASNVSIFDPSTNTFTNVQNMANGRWYPTLTTLPNGQVMTFAGLGTNGKTNTTVEIYDVNLGWGQPLAAHWTPPTYPRMHVLPTGTVFYSSPGVSSALFDPIAEGWTLDVASTNYASSRTYGTSVLLPLNATNNYDPQIMIMGGNSPATNTTEIIDMGASTPAWVSGPNMSEPRIEMNAVILPNGEVLALGGSTNEEDTSTLSLNADLYNPSTNTFTSAGANASQRLYHSVALLLPDATVWVAGGNPHQGTYNNTMEVYQPAYLFDGTGALATRPSITSAPSFVQYGSQFAVQTPDAASITSVALVRFGAVTHAFNTDQRLVWTSFISGHGSSTVTAPPNGSIAPPGYYMLFLLNSAGVPSVSTVVQFGPQPDFDITATPSLQVVSPGGGSTSYNVEMVPMGFSGTVIFGVGGLPSGASAVFNPASLTGQGTSVMTVSTSASTPNGIYSLTISATGGSLVHQPSVTLQIGSPPAATPALNPLPGTYVKSQLVAISDSTPGATIYFTTDGSMPTTSSLVYTNPISVSSSSTIRAMAAATGYNNSFVASGAYIIQPPAATPSFSPAPGTYPTAQSLIITDTTSGAIIYYTTDGSTPTTSSSVYGNPINLSSNTTVKAIVAAQGYTNSNVASGIYNVRTALPKFSPSPGTYPAAQSVTIADATNGATIYYTTDGSTPTTSSTVYSSPVSVSSNATIKAIAAAPGYTNSNVAPGIYNIRTALPSFGLAPGI